MVEQLIEVLLGKLKTLVDSETVIGQPIETAAATVIPVTKISFGFGVGSGRGKTEKEQGSGSGGGAIIEPIAIITIQEGEIRVHNLKGDSLGKVIETIPIILKKFTQSGESKKKRKGKAAK